MRFRLANPASLNYLCVEAFLNNMKLIPVNSSTELVVGVAIVDGSGNQVVIGSTVATIGATSSVTDNAASTQLVAANTSRKGLIIHNDSSAILYVKFGTTASLTDFTIRLVPQGSYEMTSPTYTGRIDGIWASAPGGAARITELT